MMTCALFAWLISRTFSANEQYFSLTINHPIILSTMVYQLTEQGIDRWEVMVRWLGLRARATFRPHALAGLHAA